MSDLTFRFEQTPEQAFQERIDGIKKWLQETDDCKCQEAQLHTTEGTQERVYWHYGYMVALVDVLRLLDTYKAQKN